MHRKHHKFLTFTGKSKRTGVSGPVIFDFGLFLRRLLYSGGGKAGFLCGFFNTFVQDLFFPEQPFGCQSAFPALFDKHI